jgi:hypothetical protein
VLAVNFTLATLEVDEVDLPLMSADLVVVRRDETDQLDWECVAISLPVTPLPQSPCRLVMTDLVDGRVLHGNAIVVRSDEQRHVFRGGGDLTGLRPTDGLHDADAPHETDRLEN